MFQQASHLLLPSLAYTSIMKRRCSVPLKSWAFSKVHSITTQKEVFFKYLLLPQSEITNILQFYSTLTWLTVGKQLYLAILLQVLAEGYRIPTAQLRHAVIVQPSP